MDKLLEGRITLISESLFARLPREGTRAQGPDGQAGDWLRPELAEAADLTPAGCTPGTWRVLAASLCRSAWPVHASRTARPCRPGSWDPGSHTPPAPQCLESWGAGAEERSPSQAAEQWLRVFQSGGPCDQTRGAALGPQLVTIVWVFLSLCFHLLLPQTPFQSSGLDTSRTTRHHGLVDRVYRERGRLGSPHRRPLSVDKHGRQISFSPEDEGGRPGPAGAGKF
ncbi:hypothetical protein P7K49_033668 [Saguinus oedipus]|uniref:Uncharacterized protein n=1 Tax=Saguinus oedipus TaxID=9490 RepID=A0ABQ9TSK7_SAGOE|nr:hypothetical protein P7K49_033668 [Saguinus oedipus]